MARSSKRYPLLIYTFLIDRWRRAVFAIGLVLLLLVAALAWLPRYLPVLGLPSLGKTSLWQLAAAGAAAMFVAFFLLLIRSSAFVQPFSDHLLLATPFLRMKISYRRLVQSASAQMGTLFPPGNIHGLQKTFLLSIASRTALVLELKGMPYPRWILALFLSRYFLPARNSSLVLLVKDWIGFSNELESMRSQWMDANRQGSKPPTNILADLYGTQ